MKKLSSPLFRMNTSPRDQAMARSTRIPLTPVFMNDAFTTVRFWRPDGREVDVKFSPGFMQLLAKILSEVRHGRDIMLVGEGADLTTQQAADLLAVSRSHLVRLLDAGELDFYRVGVSRRVPLAEVERYRMRMNQRDTSRKGRRPYEGRRPSQNR